MFKFLVIITVIFLMSYPSMAQIYEGKSEEMTAALDRAAERANIVYGNELSAGAAEEIRSQEDRYTNMVADVNEANERHFVTAVNQTQ